MMAVTGILLDGVVACLLVATIAYCIMLERRIRSFRTDQAELAGIIGKLDSATKNAEEAVAGLKVTADETGGNLDGKLSHARTMSNELAFMVEAGDSIAHKLSNSASRGGTSVLDINVARRARCQEPVFRKGRKLQSDDAPAEDRDPMQRILRRAR